MKGTQTIGTRDRCQVRQEYGTDPEPLVSIWYHERYLCALRPHLRVLDDVGGGTDQ